MKTYALVLAILPSFLSAQYKSSFINLPPLRATAIEMGREYVPNHKKAFDLAVGVVINSNGLPAYHKGGTNYEVNRSSALYSKLGVKFIARKSDQKFGPYFGVFVNAGLAIDKGYYSPEMPFDGQKIHDPITKKSLVTGLGLNTGIASPLHHSLGIEPGLQLGIVPYTGQLDWQKYTAGMGRNILGFYLQGILKIKLQTTNK